MRKMFALVVGVVLAMAIPAEAQPYPPRFESRLDAVEYYNRYRDYRGGDYDRYDPYYDGYGRGYDPYMRGGYYPPDPCYGVDQHFQGMRGTMHAHKEEIHFRPCDPTNSRIGTGTGGALASAGGAAIGGAFGGRKGAAIGGVGGAVVGGVIASRRTHDNCLVMSPVQVASQMGVQQGGGAPVSYQEQALTQPVAGPVDPLANITWPTVNTTDFRAVVTDPNTGEKKLIPAGGSMYLPDPAGEQPYTVVLLEPGRGKSNPVPGEIRPTEDLQGWEIVARN